MNENQNCDSTKKISEVKKEILNEKNEAKIANKNIFNYDLKDLLSEFECPICFEIMALPKRIYACTNDHFICSLCLIDTKISDCPMWREDFRLKRPCIRHKSERFLEILLEKHSVEID